MVITIVILAGVIADTLILACLGVPFDSDRLGDVAQNLYSVAVDAEESFGFLPVRRQPRDRPAVLGDDDLLAAFGDLVHKLQALALNSDALIVLTLAPLELSVGMARSPHD